MGFTVCLSTKFCDLVLKIQWHTNVKKINVPTIFCELSFFHQHMKKKRLLIWITRWQDAGQKANKQIQNWAEYSVWKYKPRFLNAENSWTKNIKLNEGKLISFLRNEDRFWEKIQKDWKHWKWWKIKAKVNWKRIEIMHKKKIWQHNWQ